MRITPLLLSSRRIVMDMTTKLRNPNKIPVVYFTGTPNVGDLLNEFIIPKISGKEIVKVSSAALPHLRAIGSVVGSASHLSHIWGSGSIDGKNTNRPVDIKKIYALRGEKTRSLLEKQLAVSLGHIPLGDPAILMPMFYKPKIYKRDYIGIVAHFSDEMILRNFVAREDKGLIKVISVKQSPENFIDEIASCRVIFSSSLHGLILADSYEIPNKWIKLSDDLLGGDFKFLDYYSTTNSPYEDALTITEHTDFRSLTEESLLQCKVKGFLGSHNALLENFPHEFTK